MAITSVTQEPQDYRSVYNPIEYVAISDPATRLNDRFKYLFDVYDGATQIARLKVPPNPDGYGRADIHGICESYLKTDLGEINTTATADGFTDNPNSYKQFTVEIGEEWFVGSTLNSNPNQETRTVITFNGSLPNYRGNTVNFYDWQENNFYLRYIQDISSRRWLTNAPKGSGANKSDNQVVQLTDEGWTYFLFSTTYPQITGFDLTTYNASGTLTGINTITNNVTPLAGKYMLKIPTAPNSINNIDYNDIVGGTPSTQPLIASTDTSYKIILRDVTPNIVSEEIWFNIDSECRYETRRLEFLNSLGGFDCFNFTKVSRRTEDIERKFYKQNSDNLDGSGVITYSLADRQKVQYYTKSMPKMKLTSDWVDVNTFNWLLEMLESPEIYLYENGQRITVQNIEGNWEEKRTDTDKLFNLEVNLEFGVDNYRQRF
jgi:hypothetical protein